MNKGKVNNNVGVALITQLDINKNIINLHLDSWIIWSNKFIKFSLIDIFINFQI